MRNTTDGGNQFDTMLGLFLTSFSSFIKLLNQTRKEESKKNEATPYQFFITTSVTKLIKASLMSMLGEVIDQFLI